MIEHSKLWQMWQGELAEFLRVLFYAPAPLSLHQEYNMFLAGVVWRERFGHYPTIGEIRLHTEGKI